MTTKSDIAAKIAATHGIPQTRAESIVTAVFAEIAASLRDGNEVRLHGFGIFEAKARAATTGRNPRTGEAIEIPARKAVKFKPAKALGDALNG